MCCETVFIIKVPTIARRWVFVYWMVFLVWFPFRNARRGGGRWVFQGFNVRQHLETALKGLELRFECKLRIKLWLFLHHWFSFCTTLAFFIYNANNDDRVLNSNCSARYLFHYYQNANIFRRKVFFFVLLHVRDLFVFCKNGQPSARVPATIKAHNFEQII